MPKTFDPKPIALKGEHIHVLPLMPYHAVDLYEAGNNEEIWQYMPRPKFESLEDTKRWIEDTLAASQNKMELPFTIYHPLLEKAIGSTRYLDIQRENRSLEIGWTWLGKDYQRTVINTECKYLLLRHAFEDHHAVRVCLKTDGRNLQSQKAIERIGAKKEGILRKHRIMWDHYIRDTVYYSILDTEWPEVKIHLEQLLSRI